MNAVRKSIISGIIMLGMITPAFAQNVVISSPAIALAPCVSITHTLRYGAHDRTTGGEVSLLQDFLHTKGYLNVSATGYFGPLTFRAVKAFQLASAAGAVDGIVGIQTQAHIRAMDCQTTATSAPVITSLSPSSGPTGTVVTITGTGFTHNNIVHFAIGGIPNLVSTAIGSDSTGSPQATITFTVPSTIGPYCKPDQACPLYLMLLNAGTYNVSVENEHGTSAATQFTVTGNNSTVIPQ